MKRLLVTVAVVLNLVLADAVAKELAHGLLGPGAEGGPRVVEVIPGLFNLAYVENRGCAWGMFQGRVWPLAAFGALAIAFLAWRRRQVFGGSRLGAYGGGCGVIEIDLHGIRPFLPPPGVHAHFPAKACVTNILYYEKRNVANIFLKDDQISVCRAVGA